MPATEQTWRNQARLDLIFAVSGVVLLIATILMFYRDHERPWKAIQPVAVNLEQKMTKWRQEQYKTQDAIREHDELQSALQIAQTLPIDPELMDKFVAAAGGAEPDTLPSTEVDPGKPTPAEALKRSEEYVAAAKRIQSGSFTKFNEAAAKAAAFREQAVAGEIKDTSTLEAAYYARQNLLTDLNSVVGQAKIYEDKKLTDRKFASANLDRDKAQYDLGIRDSSPDLPTRQETVLKSKAYVDQLTDEYQALSSLRQGMERVVKQMTAPVDAAQKKVDDNRAALDRLEKTLVEKRETYFVSFYGIPLPGKELLNLPILDAFGSPRKIDNLWADGLEQDYNFRKVRRFDRCTTCHQLIQKSLPGQPTNPAYPEQIEFDLILNKPEADPSEGAVVTNVSSISAEEKLHSSLLKELGLMLASEGLISADDVTVKYVRPESAAATATVGSNQGNTKTGADWLAVAQNVHRPAPPSPNAEPGLMVGDVITAINGDKVFGTNRVGQMILDILADRGTVALTVRRGAPNPFATHPRLDLFVSDASPHAMGKFACTVCHDGQGSATEFKWASHSPNSQAQADQWRDKYGWFDNHHWIYPMNPQRFTESSCLKCHHDVIELEPSSKFPEAPAPKVVHGYHLIAKYGCFGCHEINGYDGPNRRTGPDMRLEPNYFAIAQQLLFETETLPVEEASPLAKARDLADQLAMHPEDNAARHALRQLLVEDAIPVADKQPALTPSVHALADQLKDVEVPGTMRKVGPSLRYASQKLDDVFLYDWLKKPKNFRPDTRMPQFFGLWDHLKDDHGHLPENEVAVKYEPIEIRGLMAYIDSRSQTFVPLQPEEGIQAGSKEDQISRGKVAFETRGCLACHNHKDFPDIVNFRPSEEIVQGPDLSNIGAKFNPDRNPKGPAWLYSWIREPTKYHPRTVMPNMYLGTEEIPDPNAEADDKGVKPTIKVDTAADIAEYLLSVESQWEIDPQAEEPVDEKVLSELAEINLKDAVFEKNAARYVLYGIPEDLAQEFKGAERELLVSRADYEALKPLSSEQKLRYIGSKTISKYGCYACHDMPGFEDAKPIGTGLADWGRKDPAKLAFEHISHYLEHGHGHAAEHGAAEHGTTGHAEAAAHDVEPEAETAVSIVDQGKPEVSSEEFDEGYYVESINHHHRAGFAYQKLKEPRSYDYKKTENKKYNERLRMPMFPFTQEEREAVVTFVLGLVADPPQSKYVYSPQPRDRAIQAGRKVLEKYNCGGCHVLEAERWQLEFASGQIKDPLEQTDEFPFLRLNPTTAELKASAAVDRRGLHQADVHVLPQLTKGEGLPYVTDVEGESLDEEETYSGAEVSFQMDLYQPALLGGKPYAVGVKALGLSPAIVNHQIPARGGALTRYLQPRVLSLEQQSNPNASGSESWGWLPPPLMWEGEKVQSAWLHDFLLNPYPIRPAVFMRMPKFNMSSAESEALTAYFAAVDNAAYPYSYANRRETEQLQAKESNYRQQEGVMAESDETMARFDDAMKIVVDNTYCVKCHIVDDFRPQGSVRAQAPNLADVYRRMRPDYLRNWIARPTYYLPYTSMPVNIPYKPGEPNLGGVKQELFHGTSVEQLDGLVDLLMNFDVYTSQQVRVNDLIPKAAPMEEPGANPPADAADTDPPAPAVPPAATADPPPAN